MPAIETELKHPEALPETARRLLALLADLRTQSAAGEGSAVYFVDDGSRDATWQIIEALAAAEALVRGRSA